MANNPFEPKITRTASDPQKIKDALLVSLLLIAICWIAFLTVEYLHFDLRQYGLRPRQWEGLRGILTMHFLHGDIKHIAQNSLGLLVLNSFLFYFYRQIAGKIFFIILFVAPAILWLVGRPSNHIGASVLLYGEFAFLFFSGIIRRNPLLLRVSLAVIFYYGSLVWYLFPIDSKISWEGHACGFVVGLVLAIVYRNQGPQRKVYQYELEPELPDDENAYWKIPTNPKSDNESTTHPQTTITVKYHYREKKDEAPPLTN
ncbi:MAG TPA: rhomboid family intramembrane serine protease [Flavobacteriales bacterium]